MGVLRAIVASAILVGSLWLNAGAANAGLEWCDDDPIFVVGGGGFRVISVWSSGTPATALAYVLDVPSNVSARVVVPSSTPVSTTATIRRILPAWSGQGGIPAVLHATVAAAGSSSVRVAVNGTVFASATGRTNHTVNLSFTVNSGRAASPTTRR